MRWLAALFISGWVHGSQAADTPLTLSAALNTIDAPHPDLQIAQARLDMALAEQQIAASTTDATLSYEGSLRRGRTSTGAGNWLDDHGHRLVLRKNIYDFGRTRGNVEAASHEVNARRLLLLTERDARRIDIMERFFDVLLADAQYAADNELTAVHYVRFDDLKKRFELGELNARDLAQQEAQYQIQREKRGRAQNTQRSARLKLAHALNQPGRLPTLLEPPALPQNELVLPEYESLLAHTLQHNHKLKSMQAQLSAIAARNEAMRATRAPSLDIELGAGDYSRDSISRDRFHGGLILSWPLYQGERVDARLAKELAERTRLESEIELFKRNLAEALLETWQEIDWLKNTARPAAKVQTQYRDQALERARAEYELELKSNLGTAMAETQAASVHSQKVEYRLALAIAQLEALLGQPIQASRTNLTERK